MRKAAIFSAHFGRLFSAACIGFAVAAAYDCGPCFDVFALAILAAAVFGTAGLVLKSYKGTGA